MQPRQTPDALANSYTDKNLGEIQPAVGCVSEIESKSLDPITTTTPITPITPTTPTTPHTNTPASTRPDLPTSRHSKSPDHAMDVDHLLNNLTAPQREAVMHTEGPLLVLAAAGSGKTRVITRRVAYLISCGVPAWAILALTFTNKAAGEMRERVHTLLDPNNDNPRLVRGLTMSTFHSLCARLLRRYIDDAKSEGVNLGIKSDFTIFTSPDQAAAIKSVILASGLSTTNWPPRSVLSAISSAKNKLLDAHTFSAQAGDFYSKNIAALYTRYQEKLRKANAVDFDDLLLLTVRMLSESKTVLAQCNQRWQYLLLDEYQDTNHAQFMIASLLAGDHAGAASTVEETSQNSPENAPPAGPNICVVGDPDQAIYSWRGADISNILDFEERYPNAAVIRLGENFRSTEPILASADSLIRNNTQRKHKDLFTTSPGGEPVQIILCRDEQHEAQLVADYFQSKSQDEDGKGFAWRDMAVLYRTNALSRVMEDALRTASIPYVVARGTAFYDREEIKTALAYLRVIANPADDVSLLRIINTPPRGIGNTTLSRIRNAAENAGITLFDGLNHAHELDGLSARAINAVQGFVKLMQGWTGGGTFMGTDLPGTFAQLVERVIRESGIEKAYKKQALTSKSETDAERLDNLDELISSAAQFEDEYDPDSDPFAFAEPTDTTEQTPAAMPPLLGLLRAYLEKVSLVADSDAIDPAQGSITLMTLHAAKGLEFSVVAMIGLEEGLLPHSRALSSLHELEEERRLCFVGMTRAKKQLLMTSAKLRTFRGMSQRTIPSRFLDELPRPHAHLSDQSDAWSPVDDTIDSYNQPPATGKLAKAMHEFPKGCAVRHPQFGLGKILSLQGGNSVRAKVEFKQAGTKTLVLEYARLVRVS